jgi:hypothetical protein
MQIGPVQLLVIGFDNDENFRGQIKAELDAVRTRGTIRLIDALFVHKDASGAITTLRDSDLDDAAAATYGATVSYLLGLAGSADGASSAGIGPGELQAILAELPPGTAAALVLFEHRWAAGLGAAVRDAGGHILAQGLLTRDLVLAMGAEMRAIADAELAIETAQALKGAAILDTLIFVEGIESAKAEVAAAVTTTVAAEVVRSLIIAGVIDNEEIEPAIAALVTDGLLDVELVKGALQAAAASEAEVQALVAAQAG